MFVAHFIALYCRRAVPGSVAVLSLARDWDMPASKFESWSIATQLRQIIPQDRNYIGNMK
jgi:hypothetical protein